MDQPIEDGVGQGGIADDLVPFLQGQLTDGQGEASPVSVFQDLQQVARRVTALYHLSPLSRQEVGECLDHLLDISLSPTGAVRCEKTLLEH